MQREPLTKQRSKWELRTGQSVEQVRAIIESGGSRDILVYERNVSDGHLSAVVSKDAGKWHMSISFTDHRGQASRYPRWDEIADARYTLCPDEITMAMLLPPSSEYVSVHATAFHLHEIEGEFPSP